MTSKVNGLSKMMIVYQCLYMTNEPTRIIREALASLKISFRKVLTNQEDVYREAEKYQIELYDKAWNECFVAGTGQMIEIGTIVNLIYDSVEPKEARRYIGAKKMDKVITSYYLSPDEKIDAYEVESRSTMFADKIIEMFDGKKKISAFQRRLNTIKQNRIIEGKDNERYKDGFNKREDTCDS